MALKRDGQNPLALEEPARVFYLKVAKETVQRG
jgi:hypothetical protein